MRLNFFNFSILIFIFSITTNLHAAKLDKFTFTSWNKPDLDVFYECFKTQKRDKLYFFENENDFPRKILSTKLDEGINLYFKGSRSSKMERYIDIIKNA